jgi:hypothetical protein
MEDVKHQLLRFKEENHELEAELRGAIKSPESLYFNSIMRQLTSTPNKRRDYSKYEFQKTPKLLSSSGKSVLFWPETTRTCSSASLRFPK